MNKTTLAAALALAFAPGLANAHDELAACAKAALKLHPGKIVKLEVKSENKATVYEFDIQKTDGSSWDIECQADGAKITEVEEEVSPTDPRWTAKAKISEADAKAAALKARPGKVIEVEYEIEPDGALSYEFDILGKDGKEYKVEVDAVTGKVVETSEELVQIGEG